MQRSVANVGNIFLRSSRDGSFELWFLGMKVHYRNASERREIFLSTPMLLRAPGLPTPPWSVESLHLYPRSAWYIKESKILAPPLGEDNRLVRLYRSSQVAALKR